MTEEAPAPEEIVLLVKCGCEGTDAHTIDTTAGNQGRFPFNPKVRNFGWLIKWNGPFRFGPTGIFGTSFEGGPL